MAAPERLYLAYMADQPPLAEYDIKCQTQRRFFESEFIFAVIGDSHYIGAPELGFHELFSCKPVRQGRVTTVPLTGDLRPAKRRQPIKNSWLTGGKTRDDGYEVHNDRYRFKSMEVTTTIRCEPLSMFPGPDPFEIAYQFGPEAYTTIDCRSATAYETYHTYPEYDLALYSEHEFTDLPATPADSTSGHKAPSTKVE